MDSPSNTIIGFYTTLWQNGAQIQQGFSSVTFSVSNGQTYQVAVADYGNYTFNHWSDGTTARLHNVTTGTGTTTSLTAVYSKTSWDDPSYSFNLAIIEYQIKFAYKGNESFF